jgi:hypothetical protein
MKHLKLTLCSLVALFAAGQAFAHTEVRDAAIEGTDSYNAFTQAHGCANNTEGGPAKQQYPVLGVAALFPHGDNVVWRDQAGAVIQAGGNGNGVISTPKLSLGVTSIEGGSPFATVQELVDRLGVVQGLLYKDGVMAPNNSALPPFKVLAPTIVDNCVKSIQVRIGVISYCDVNKNAANDAKGPYEAPKDALGKKIKKVKSLASGLVQANPSHSGGFNDLPNGNGDNNRADWWFMMPEGGSVYYNDPDMVLSDFWTTLIVNNSPDDLAKCTGTQTEVSVEPTGRAFDTILTPANTQPFTTKGVKGGL